MRDYLGLTRWRMAGIGIILLASIYSFSASCSEPSRFSCGYDAALYHLQIVRWLNEYGTPLGIGNLHIRLANGSAWLVLAALLNHGFLKGIVAWCMTPFFLTSFAAYLLQEILENRFAWSRIYALCLLPVCVYVSILWSNPNLYHDLPALALICIAGLETLYFISDSNSKTEKQAAIILICVALSFSVKPLSAVSLFIAPMIVIYTLYLNNMRKINKLATIFVMPFSAAVVWSIRSFIVSGYPFFPSSLFAFPVDWRIPKCAVDDLVLNIRGWAGLPGPQFVQAFDTGISYWFSSWLDNLFQDEYLIFIIVMPFFIGTTLWIALTGKKRLATYEFLLFIWPIFSIIYWFWVAPDTRFGAEYFWFFMALGAACLAPRRISAMRSPGAQKGLASCRIYLVCLTSRIASIVFCEIAYDRINVPRLREPALSRWFVSLTFPRSK